MINLGKLLEYEYAEVMGKVVVNKDPELQRRLKIEVPGFNDKEEPDNLEWVEMQTASLANTMDVPNVGDIVYLCATHGELRWRHIDFIEQECIRMLVGDDDYLKSLVVAYKNLEKFKGQGQLFIGWTETDGLRLIKDLSRIELRKDNSVHLWNGSKSIHINGDTISLGSENRSKEPAVMGDQNEIALSKLNDMVKAFASITNNMMQQLATAMRASPYTAHLAPAAISYGQTALSQIQAKHSEIASQIPKTKSTIVNLD